jgi:hypothetical protein
LIRIGECGKEDALVNGDFRDGFRLSDGETVTAGGIKGWRATKSIKVGLGKNYNRRWAVGNPVVVLEGNGASDIYQSIVFDTDFSQISDDQI